MTRRQTQAYRDARHLMRRHQQEHGELRGVIARRPEPDPSPTAQD